MLKTTCLVPQETALRFLRNGVVGMVLFLVFPALLLAGQVTIDQAMPDTIPAAIIEDWKKQDGTSYAGVVERIKKTIPAKFADKITGTGEQGYISACHWRRVARMQRYSPELERIIYARHHDLGGPTIGYIEDMNSDGVRGIGRWGMPGVSKSSDYPRGAANSAILKLVFDDFYPSPETLIEDTRGVIRDPCPSYDGTTLVYAHSKDNNGYHINELNMETGATRQITDDPEGLTVSDFEPCVLPSGDIVFNSSRCFGHVDVNVNLTCNLYVCNRDGKYLRRIGYDQVHTFYPTMVEDGTIMYTRWEYNDRNIASCCGIFTMNQDGGRQQEFYGNQTEWPAYIIQARSVPGNPMRTLAIISGHIGPYAGDLAVIDASRKRNGGEGVQLVAPKRSNVNKSVTMEGVPDGDKLFQNPYPLDDEWFLISYRTKRSVRFQVFLMNMEGERELIAWDAAGSVSQPISLMPRVAPVITSSLVDLSDTTAEVSVSDVYYGQSMAGVSKGAVRKIRVVGLEYRTDPAFGHTGGEAYQMTPIGRYGCSWIAKWILGEMDVEEDGSAAFIVPPNTPLFFQLIAEDGTCVQTMRSWMTLMPGERFDCFGCHEDKNAAPPDFSPNAVQAKPLNKFYAVQPVAGSFYYPDVIQPVLDKNCVKSGCHDASHGTLDLTATKLWTNDLDDADNRYAYRFWNTSYYNLSKSNYVNCNAVFGSAAGIPPRSTGSSRSALIDTLRSGHRGVKLSGEEMGKLCAWIDLSIPHSGTYTDDMTEEHKAQYLKRLERREKEQAIEAQNIKEFVASGAYGVPPYNNAKENVVMPRVGHGASSAPNGFSVRFLASQHILSLQVPSEGKITLIDLMGRRIYSHTISRESFLADARLNVRVNLSAGTYIARFEGTGRSGERPVSVL